MTRASDCQVRTVSFVIIALATDPKLSILIKNTWLISNVSFNLKVWYAVLLNFKCFIFVFKIPFRVELSAEHYERINAA